MCWIERRIGPGRAALCAGVALLATFSAAAAGKTHSRAFDAVRGDRTSGWILQTRSEVLARNGIVATSQPLAAQAGPQILPRASGRSRACISGHRIIARMGRPSVGER